jgi:calcium-dependent protein kinase
MYEIENFQTIINEINLLKSLDHPNIMKIYEYFADEQQFYIVSEYCEGGELFDFIQSRGTMNETIIAKIFHQIMSALLYCHNHQIIHRDIKPENLLLKEQIESDDSDFDIKLIDFGASLQIDNKKKANQVVGTPYYVAPEVLMGSYDSKCDIWSAGVILYIMLCGYPPFYGDNDDEILQKVILGDYQMEGEEWDQVSQDAKDLIRKTICFDSRNRYNAD